MSHGVRSIAFLDLSISSIVNKATLRLLDLFPPSDEKFGGHVRVVWKRKFSWSVALALFHADATSSSHNRSVGLHCSFHTRPEFTDRSACYNFETHCTSRFPVK